MTHRLARRVRPWGVALMGALVSTCPGLTQEPAKELPFSAVVSVLVRDTAGKALRVVNGTVLEAGVLVELTALRGGNWVEVHSRDGSWWQSDSVIVTNRQMNLALLKMPEIASNTIPIPDSASYTDGSRLILIGGPGGEIDSISVTAYRHFSLRGGFDLIPLSRAFPGAAPALASDGRLIGISVDLSTAEASIGCLIPTVSVRVVVGSIPRSRPISDFTEVESPDYVTDQSSQGLTLRGAILARSGIPELAEGSLRQALKMDEHYADAHYWMGEVLLMGDEHQRAAESFKNAAAGDSMFSRAWQRAGIAYSGAGLYQDAETMYLKALEIDTCSAECYIGLGVVRFKENRHDEAIDALQKSIACDSTYSGGFAFYHLVSVYNAMDRREEAERTCDRLSRSNPELAERARHMLDGHHH